MKIASLFLAILLSFLLLLSLCHAKQENVAEFNPAGVATKNGEEAEQEEKFKFLHHHKPYFKKPFLKPIPFKKKPFPVHPFLKKPFNPPVFPIHP